MSMIHLTNARDVGELAIIRSLLDGNNIRYLVYHEHISSLYPGIASLMGCVMVEESEHSRAEILLSRLRLPIREATNSV